MNEATGSSIHTKKHFWQKKAQKELTVDDITIVDNEMLKRAVGAAALGNAMEWFDFGVYSYLAVTIGKVFFPGGSPAPLPPPSWCVPSAACFSARSATALDVRRCWRSP